MNNNRPTPADSIMRGLIDRYFEGMTTLEEEKTLRTMLARSTDTSPDVEAARAVLGVFAAARRVDRKTLRPRRRLAPLVSAVASVAVLLVATVALADTSEASEIGKCYASVGGRLIEDRSEVQAIVSADFASISDASRSIETSISDDLSILSQSIDSSK